MYFVCMDKFDFLWIAAFLAEDAIISRFYDFIRKSI